MNYTTLIKQNAFMPSISSSIEQYGNHAGSVLSPVVFAERSVTVRGPFGPGSLWNGDLAVCGPVGPYDHPQEHTTLNPFAFLIALVLLVVWNRIKPRQSGYEKWARYKHSDQTVTGWKVCSVMMGLLAVAWTAVPCVVSPSSPGPLDIGTTALVPADPFVAPFIGSMSMIPFGLVVDVPLSMEDTAGTIVCLPEDRPFLSMDELQVWTKRVEVPLAVEDDATVVVHPAVRPLPTTDELAVLSFEPVNVPLAVKTTYPIVFLTEYGPLFLPKFAESLALPTCNKRDDSIVLVHTLSIGSPEHFEPLALPAPLVLHVHEPKRDDWVALLVPKPVRALVPTTPTFRRVVRSMKTIAFEVLDGARSWWTTAVNAAEAYKFVLGCHGIRLETMATSVRDGVSIRVESWRRTAPTAPSTIVDELLRAAVSDWIESPPKVVWMLYRLLPDEAKEVFHDEQQFVSFDLLSCVCIGVFVCLVYFFIDLDTIVFIGKAVIGALVFFYNAPVVAANSVKRFLKRLLVPPPPSILRRPGEPGRGRARIVTGQRRVTHHDRVRVRHFPVKGYMHNTTQHRTNEQQTLLQRRQNRTPDRNATITDKVAWANATWSQNWPPPSDAKKKVRWVIGQVNDLWEYNLTDEERADKYNASQEAASREPMNWEQRHEEEAWEKHYKEIVLPWLVYTSRRSLHDHANFAHNMSAVLPQIQGAATAMTGRPALVPMLAGHRIVQNEFMVVVGHRAAHIRSKQVFSSTVVPMIAGTVEDKAVRKAFVLWKHGLALGLWKRRMSRVQTELVPAVYSQSKQAFSTTVVPVIAGAVEEKKVCKAFASWKHGLAFAVWKRRMSRVQPEFLLVRGRAICRLVFVRNVLPELMEAAEEAANRRSTLHDDDNFAVEVDELEEDASLVDDSADDDEPTLVEIEPEPTPTPRRRSTRVRTAPASYNVTALHKKAWEEARRKRDTA